MEMDELCHAFVLCTYLADAASFTTISKDLVGTSLWDLQAEEDAREAEVTNSRPFVQLSKDDVLIVP